MPILILRALASTVDVTGRKKSKGVVKTTGEVPGICPKGAAMRVKAQGFSEMPIKRTTVESLKPDERGFVFKKYRFVSEVRNPRTETARRRKARLRNRKKFRKLRTGRKK